MDCQLEAIILGLVWSLRPSEYPSEMYLKDSFETETEFIAKFKKLKKIIYNTMIVMNLAKEPGEASL